MNNLLKALLANNLNINPEQAKKQIMQMVQNGQINNEAVQRIRNFSKQMGIEKQVDNALEELGVIIENKRKNRW